jgi:lysophospholipase
MGVIPGNDMTPEAALTKLSYVLSKDEWDIDYKRQMMKTNLRGEMTVLKFKDEESRKSFSNDDQDMTLIEAVAKALHIQSSEEMEGLTEVLLPSLMCAAVYTGNKSKLQALRSSYGVHSDAALSDYDQRTPLHIAASEGNIGIVEYLLKNGASVHARDRNDGTPLVDAIREGHTEVIQNV